MQKKWGLTDVRTNERENDKLSKQREIRYQRGKKVVSKTQHVEKERKAMMTDENDARRRITCECGKIIQQRNFTQHCLSKRHLSYFAKHQPKDDQPLSSNDSLFSLTSYLRETDLRTDSSRLRTIVERYQNTDPYTKAIIDLTKTKSIPGNFHVDHIHEAQLLACAIHHTAEFLPYTRNIVVLRPLRSVLNDVPNLAITEAAINQSKGQAIRYFLGHYETDREISLLASFVQTATGKERSIAHISMNIIDLIRETSPMLSESLRETRMENGHVSGASRYETVAEQFDPNHRSNEIRLD